MPSRQGDKGRANDSSQINSSLNESHKDGLDGPYKDPRPRWRRLLASRICWIITVTAMLLLGLVLGLSIGLTRSSSPPPSNVPGAPQLLGAVVDLGYTKYQGDTYPGGISQWLGIRYAQPPVGDLRFAAPQSITGNGTLQMAIEVRQKRPSLVCCLANIWVARSQLHRHAFRQWQCSCVLWFGKRRLP